MTTLAAGNTAEIFCPLATAMTFTPGADGSVRVSVSVKSGSPAIAPRMMQSATTLDISPGATVFVEAVGADATYSGVPSITGPGDEAYALSETTPYVTLTATGTAFTGACELAGWYCSVAAGNITIYDATSATGTPIVPATALVAGPMPIFGTGTNGKLRLTTGCHVVLSGAATVRVLVA